MRSQSSVHNSITQTIDYPNGGVYVEQAFVDLDPARDEDLLSITSEDPRDVTTPGELESETMFCPPRERKLKLRCTLHPDCQWTFLWQYAQDYRKHAFVHHRLERSISEARILTHLVGESMGIQNARSPFLENSLRTGLGRRYKPDLPRARNIVKEQRILASWDNEDATK